LKPQGIYREFERFHKHTDQIVEYVILHPYLAPYNHYSQALSFLAKHYATLWAITRLFYEIAESVAMELYPSRVDTLQLYSCPAYGLSVCTKTPIVQHQKIQELCLPLLSTDSLILPTLTNLSNLLYFQVEDVYFWYDITGLHLIDNLYKSNVYWSQDSHKNLVSHLQVSSLKANAPLYFNLTFTCQLLILSDRMHPMYEIAVAKFIPQQEAIVKFLNLPVSSISIGNLTKLLVYSITSYKLSIDKNLSLMNKLVKFNFPTQYKTPSLLRKMNIKDFRTLLAYPNLRHDIHMQYTQRSMYRLGTSRVLVQKRVAFLVQASNLFYV